jgi:hypothetical protein
MSFEQDWWESIHQRNDQSDIGNKASAKEACMATHESFYQTRWPKYLLEMRRTAVVTKYPL